MKRKKLRLALLSSAALALMTSGCGGGGGGAPPGDGTGVVIPAPTPPPPPAAPTPPPPPPAPVATPFPPFNLAATQNFAVFGYSVGFRFSGLTIAGSDAVNASEPITLRFNGTTGSYEAGLPRFPAGRLVINSNTGGRGYTVTNGVASNDLQPLFVNFTSGQIGRDAQGRDLALSFSNVAAWEGRTSDRDVFGYFAFGSPTPPVGGGIPQTGTRTYGTRLFGLTEAFTRAGSVDFRFLDGAGSLRFDFGAAGLSGTVTIGSSEFGREEGFGTFALTGGGVAADGTFRGIIVVPGSNESGEFEGQFMGPDASEIIVRWRMPLRIPSAGVTAPAFGVWAGKAS